MANAFFRMGPWFHRKIVDPLLQILRRGAEPKQLAFSAAVGISLGVFPICELSLMVPFLRLGEVITGGPHFLLTSDAFKKVLTGQASKEVLQSILHARLRTKNMDDVSVMHLEWLEGSRTFPLLLGWLVALPFILATLHVLFLPCFKILVRKFSTVIPSSPKKPLSSHTEVRLKCKSQRVLR
ncbi:unnamed protein product [Camellia sinensis]